MATSPSKAAPAGDFIVNGGTVTLADGTVITGNSPGDHRQRGQVILQGVTAQTATNSPDDRRQRRQPGRPRQHDRGIDRRMPRRPSRSTAARVDLGTAASPGGNTFNVNGTGTLIENTTGSAVPAVGDTFENNGAAGASSFGTVEPLGPGGSDGQPGGSAALQPGLADGYGQRLPILGGRHQLGRRLGSHRFQRHVDRRARRPISRVRPAGHVHGDGHGHRPGRRRGVGLGPRPDLHRDGRAVDLRPRPVGRRGLLSRAMRASRSPAAVVVDSSSSSALSASGNASGQGVRHRRARRVQKSGNASFSPAPVTGAAAIARPARDWLSRCRAPSA